MKKIDDMFTFRLSDKTMPLAVHMAELYEEEHNNSSISEIDINRKQYLRRYFSDKCLFRNKFYKPISRTLNQ